jgi:MtN3 and saliva related transmembrane protein
MIDLLASNWTIGMAAGTLTTISFLPQVVKTWRSRSAEDLSLGMLILFTTGIVLWIAYGFSAAAAPVVISNVVTLGLALALLGMKLRWG